MASVAEQTTDAQVEEKKVIDETKTLEGKNVKEAGVVGESDEPKGERQLSLETATTDARKTIQDEEETRTAELKKENEDDKVPPGVLEDKKDDALVASDVREENECTKHFGSEVSVNSKDDTFAIENVQEKPEIGKFSSSEVPVVETSKADAVEKENTAEPLSKAVENLVVEPEMSSVQESEQVGQESKVSEPVIEITKGPEEPSDIIADPEETSEQVGQESKVSEPVIEITKGPEEPSDIIADPEETSETVEDKALSVVKHASEAAWELEKKNEIHKANNLLEASKDENILTNVVEPPCEVSKEEPDVKESGDTSASQSLEVNDSEKIKGAKVNRADVCKDESNDDGGELSTTESLVKELTVDPSLSKDSKPSAVGVEAGPIDNNLVREASENTVKPVIKKEQEKEHILDTEPPEEQREEKAVETEGAEEQKREKTLETVLVEEQKEENNIETEAVEEQKEEKTLETNSTLTCADETGDQSNPADELSKTYIKEENSECTGKVTEEQRNLDGSDSAIKATEIPSEKATVHEVSEEPIDKGVTDDTTLTHTSRDINLEGQKDEADATIKEPVDKPEKTEKEPTAVVEKDETGDKKDEAEQTDSQKLIESSKDGASSKVDGDAQKLETPTKPKSLMSKLKRSIVKVKKAIIGKSPGSRTISAEAKDAPEVR